MGEGERELELIFFWEAVMERTQVNAKREWKGPPLKSSESDFVEEKEG